MPHTTPLRRVLIANRGEIAARIARTCHALGLEVVAVFSDADADALHVRAAERAVRIGPAPARDSYLDAGRLIDAARRAGADAIHPGYGFLSENAAFAAAVRDAGLTFIGPTPEVIAAMGSKIEAKARAVAAGVPIVPGYSGPDQSVEALVEAARGVGFPFLIKASAGGGGKGMRVLRDGDAEHIIRNVEAARREAESAFGDGSLMIERYVDRPRHVEIQILGDAHGQVVHLFERECSIQRRHQKIIEESPSLALDEATRARMGAAAVALGQAIGYTSAGTVEFILDPEGRFYFLEVNTRLQVEHPVTEAITGLDLVAEQLRVAQGEALRFGQDDLTRRGAAIECRLYAEDPDQGFLPATGRLAAFELPPAEGVRLDAGVEAGGEVSTHYDPMLAKLITWGHTRPEATRRMIAALRRFAVHGVRTNREYLLRILEHPAWSEGALHTHFLEEHAAALAPPSDDAPLRRAALAATLAGHEARRASRRHLPALEPGFRNNPVADQHLTWRSGDAHAAEVRYTNLGGGSFRVQVGSTPEPSIVRRVAWAAPWLAWEDEGGLLTRARITSDPPHYHVLVDGRAHDLIEQPRFPDRRGDEIAGGLTAPMPGQVLQLLVSVGQPVEAGAILLILEAMKMEQPITAPHAGTVTAIHVELRQQVEVGALLVVIEAEAGG